MLEDRVLCARTMSVPLDILNLPLDYSYPIYESGDSEQHEVKFKIMSKTR